MHTQNAHTGRNMQKRAHTEYIHSSMHTDKRAHTECTHRQKCADSSMHTNKRAHTQQQHSHSDALTQTAHRGSNVHTAGMTQRAHVSNEPS